MAAAAGETTIVVELCERLEDLATELIQKIAARLGGSAGSQLEQQCTKRVNTGDLKGLVDALVGPLTNDCMVPSNQLLPGQVPAADVPINPEVAFSLFLVLLRRLPNDMITPIVSKACEGLSSNKDNSALRAKCLCSLYSALPPNSKSRYTVFKTLVDYIGDKTVITENLESSQIAALCASWNEASPDKVRALLLSVADALKASSPAKSQQSILAYLSTFKTAQEASAADLKRIKECAVNAIRDPVAFLKESILNLAAIQRLKTEDALLYQFLEVVAGDSLEKYKSFISANPQVGATYNIDQDKTYEKMQLLALTSLGSDSDRALSYDEVASALRIKREDVEPWIIKGIAAGVVDAKMDQIGETVVVHRAPQRAFNDEQWIRLSAQLKKWRASVRGIAQSVQSSKEQQMALNARANNA